MISLEINNNGEHVAVTGIRTKASSIYVPGQTESFRISRSKLNDFLSCQRCFYLDRVKGLSLPLRLVGHSTRPLIFFLKKSSTSAESNRNSTGYSVSMA